MKPITQENGRIGDDSIEVVYQRICRVYRTTRLPALLYIDATGSWWVGRQVDGRDDARCRRYDDAGYLVGAYKPSIDFVQLTEDVENHIHELSGRSD